MALGLFFRYLVSCESMQGCGGRTQSLQRSNLVSDVVDPVHCLFPIWLYSTESLVSRCDRKGCRDCALGSRISIQRVAELGEGEVAGHDRLVLCVNAKRLILYVSCERAGCEKG